jgi:hypothetical protein
MEEEGLQNLQIRQSHIRKLMDSYSLVPFPQDDDFVFIDKDFYPPPQSPGSCSN